MVDEATVMATKLRPEGAIQIDMSGCTLLVEKEVLTAFDVKAAYCCGYEYLWGV
jgi:hypothetical protein